MYIQIEKSELQREFEITYELSSNDCKLFISEEKFQVHLNYVIDILKINVIHFQITIKNKQNIENMQSIICN